MNQFYYKPGLYQPLIVKHMKFRNTYQSNHHRLYQFVQLF